MLSQGLDDSWDLTPVIDLIYSLSSQDDPFIADNGSLPSAITHPVEGDDDGAHSGEHSLGNFDTLWRFLGQPFDTPPPVIAPTFLAPRDLISDKGRYTSGVLEGEKTSDNSVRCQDELHGTNIRKDEVLHAPLLSFEPSKRKKKPKKHHEEILINGGLPIIITASSGEDSDTGQNQLPYTPDRKSIIYEILYGNTPNGGNSTRYGISIAPTSTSPFKHAKTFSLKDVSPPKIAKYNSRSKPHPRDNLSAAAKKAKLVLNLCERFPAENDCIRALAAPESTQTTDCLAAAAVHVFVDVSNVSPGSTLPSQVSPLTINKIMIGFHDSFKTSRGMPISSRIPRVPFSFHNLTLILERGRPSAKRVLVGSDKFPAIDEAKQIGYETNILDRVHKAKELTPRQKKFLNGNGISEQSSGSETTAMYAPQKWVEQAVDEILHLKMMESIVDSKEPSTMVLATGDAAEAEYSQGFLKMVERALEKGWKVELVSFKQNTSGAYKRGDFRAKWGKMFKIIELDDYTEELVAL